MNSTTEYLSDVQIMIRDAFKDLQFDKRRHLYSVVIDGRLIYLPSVTKLVESHCPKFNEAKMLPLSSRKQGIPVEELKQQWHRTAEEGRRLGTKTHDFLERFTGVETPTSPQEEAGINYIKSLAGKYRISFRELRAYSKYFLFAGTMDLPLEVIEGNSFEVADYKTNSTDLFKAYDYMYAPFQYLEASPYNKYQLQLSYYQIFLEEIGLRISNRRLVHLRDDATYKVYDLYDFSEALRENLQTKAA